MSNWFKTWRLDAVNVGILALASVGLSAFLLQGAFLDTTYADWMYHAFRAQSVMSHGLVSWDSVWDNGLSYWRAYQMIPAVITASVATVFHLSAPKAMIVLSVVLYALLHIGVYAAVRSFGRSRTAAFAAALLSFMFTGYWLLMREYSISYAAVMVAPMLILWHRSAASRTRQLIFAALIGVSIYVHPLLALCFGGLWAFDKFIRRSNFSWRWSGAELLVMVLPAVFYVYGLVAMDLSFVAPYQLGQEFIYAIAGAFRAGTVFTIIIPAMLVVAIFMSRWLSGPAQVLFWFTTIVTAVALLNLHTTYTQALNRFQVSRTLFFIAVSYLIVFGDVIESALGALKRVPNVVKGAALAALVGIAVGQTLADTSIYGANPVRQLPDPVAAYLASHPGVRVDGGIFILGSTVSSYNHPELRFSNGYNDQLLPQLTNDRLSSLLKEESPAITISATTSEIVRNYIQVLGIQYVFLPATSPYLATLTSNGFTVAARQSGDGYRSVVLRAPGSPQYTANISELSAKTLEQASLKGLEPGTRQFNTALDAAIARVAALQSNSTPVGPPASLVFTGPDTLTLNVQNSTAPQYIYVAQSYSKFWVLSAGSAARTAEGMMVITVPAGTTSVELHHTWGVIPYIQTGAVAATLIIISGGAAIEARRRKHTAHAEPEVL